MATVYIHSGNQYLYSKCRAYFEAHGHTITASGPADAAIIDLDYGPPPVMGAGIIIYLSVQDYQHANIPEHALFRLKPVDIDCLMERVLDILKNL